jgi:NAD(P)-dependent dehydrogenase (short-subunit alcohol dehydrogenase family)
MKLHGRNTIITGGSQGLGRHLVEAFLAEGANVVFCARTAAVIASTQAELSTRLQPGQRLEGLVCDVADPTAVAALFSDCATRGPLHAVVNNAAIHGPIGPTEQIDVAAWNQAWQVNVTGTLLVCQHAIRAMKPQGGGKIINLSGGGAATPRPNFAAYAATKAAVVRLTETLAEEVRADHIDVNAVAPGALRTRLAQEVLDAGPQKAGPEYTTAKEQWDADTFADPKRAAALCVFLASPASDGITGKLLSALWDPWETLPQRRAELQGDLYTLRRIIPKDRGLDFGR